MKRTGTYLDNMVDEAMSVTDYKSLSADELSEHCRLLEEIRKWSVLEDGDFHSGEVYERRMEAIADELTARCKETANLCELAFLDRAIHDLDNGDICFFDETCSDFDNRLIDGVLQTRTNDSRIVRILFDIFSQGFVASACMEEGQESEGDMEDRRWMDCNDYLCDLLRMYVGTQNADGSWKGVSLEEAYIRMLLLIKYGNWLPDINEEQTALSAYDYYSGLSCDTASEFCIQYSAAVAMSRYGRSIPRACNTFDRAVAMLADTHTSLTDRLRLQRVALQAGVRHNPLS